MPALALIVSLLLRNRPFGNILAGVALLKTLTLIVSILIGESITPLYGTPANYDMIGIYSAVIIFTLVLTIMYLHSYKKNGQLPAATPRIHGI